MIENATETSKIKSCDHNEPSSSSYTKGLQGIIHTLQELSRKDNRVLHAATCHRDVSFCTTDWSDIGWGCGYRNIQTILSSLMITNVEFYRRAFKKSGILTVAEIQAGIEHAWQCGYDIEGAAQLKWKLSGTRKWIGTTEAYAFLTAFGVDCSIVQFEGTSHVKKMMGFCEAYFSVECKEKGEDVQENVRGPMYLQHQGHSRTIVGIAKTQDGTALLVLDPAHRVTSLMRKLVQALSVARGDVDVDKSIRIRQDWPWHKLLKDYLISEKSLSKKQYQLLRVNGLLHDSVDLDRKVIRPILI